MKFKASTMMKKIIRNDLLNKLKSPDFCVRSNRQKLRVNWKKIPYIRFFVCHKIWENGENM